MRVLWLPEALDDVERLFDFLIEKDATAAERAVRTISSSAANLQDPPQIGDTVTTTRSSSSAAFVHPDRR